MASQRIGVSEDSKSCSQVLQLRSGQMKKVRQFFTVLVNSYTVVRPCHGREKVPAGSLESRGHRAACKELSWVIQAWQQNQYSV